MAKTKTDINPGFFDRPEVKKRLWQIMWILCGLSLLLELFVKRKSHFPPIDSIFGFYALLGFVSCTISILVAKGLGFFLKKKEDYYDHLDQ